MFKGIDVSKWQGKINWQDIKDDGVEFVIIREGYGKKSPTQIDKKFYENYESAKSLEIPVGCYHYSYAANISDAKYEAEFCLENIKDKLFDYPICFDIEDKEILKLSNRERTDICKAFCDEIESAGYYAMIYCNLNWWNSYLISLELAPKYDLWIAEWGKAKPSVNCGILQYSESGTIDGIAGNVDLNIAYKNYPEIIKNKGLNGFSKSLKTSNYTTYTVKPSDSLWEISEKLLGEGSKCAQIKEFNNMSNNIIYPSQILKIPKDIF